MFVVFFQEQSAIRVVCSDRLDEQLPPAAHPRAFDTLDAAVEAAKKLAAERASFEYYTRISLA